MTNRYLAHDDPKICDEALQKASEPMTMTDQVLTWCLVHGALQLAMRHPQISVRMSPISHQRLTDFISKLGFALVDIGFLTPEILAEAIRRERDFHAKQLT